MNPRIVEGYAARTSMSVGEAEADIYRVIQQVSHSIAYKYTFGYNSIKDIEQDAFIFALEILAGDAYDPARPLENFLYVHLRRRLANNVRKNFYRGEPPCSCCGNANANGGASPTPCKKWLDWQKRNSMKQNIMRPVDVDNISDDRETRMATSSVVADDAISNEILEAIDRDLPVELRADYIRMRSHVSIPKVRRDRVREAVLGILAGEKDDG